jgi:hypothetical protein
MTAEPEREVVRLASELQAEADALLQESELLDRLSGFGEVVITGSYRYRLMTNADLDLYVISPDFTREHAKALLCALIDQAFWRGFLFEDWVQFQHEGLPAGLYLGLKLGYRGRFWKVDIWGLREQPPSTAKLAEAMAALTEEQRKAILLIKQWRDRHAQGVPSTDIYEAVRLGHAWDVESFQRVRV